MTTAIVLVVALLIAGSGLAVSGVYVLAGVGASLLVGSALAFGAALLIARGLQAPRNG